MDVFKTLLLDTPDALSNISGVLPVVNGGTGASTASGARTNLGLGTSAVLDAGAANGVATLGSDSKLTSSQLPDIAVVDYLGSVASQAAMLALTGQKGDWCTRSDLGTNWVITGSTPSSLSSWTQLSYPTAPVTSVAGKTGAVTLTSSDVGLGNVTNNAQTQASIVPNTAPSSGQILVGNAGGTAYAPVSASGDVTIASTGAHTLATVNSNVGSFGSATAAPVVTVNGKGLVTAVSTSTITPAVGSITGLGTGVATALAVNVGSAGAPVVNGGALGTPSSGTLTSCTSLPVSTGISGLGTGIATALAVNTGSAGAPVLFNGALGTPSSGTVTNLTGTASININGTVGATTANTGAFTTLSASSTVSGTGFSTYLASPPAIGGTTAAAGTFTTLTANTQLIGKGTATNDSASAGYVGEFLSANAASSAVSLTSTTPANATSLSLTAGDWDVSSDIRFAAASASTVTTYVQGGISQTSATLPSEGVNGGAVKLPVNVNTNLSFISVVIPTIRISLASTTTIYLVADASFTVAGLNCGGSIRARRVR